MHINRPFFTPMFVFVLIACATLVGFWRAMQSYPLPLFDLYPLYYGAQAWLGYGNAYDLGLIVPPGDHSFSVFQIGNGYPLPAILLTMPLSFLPPTVAAVLWVTLLTAGLLLALRLYGNGWWLLLYLPILEGLRIEQYTVLVVILQIVALWALRAERPWILAICCALMLTKPSHALFFTATILFLGRPWRQFSIAMVVVWGSSLLLDPGWVGQWLAAMRSYAAAAQQPILWWIAPAVALLLWSRNWISAAIMFQITVMPTPPLYPASALPLGVLDDQRIRWLSVLSFLWPIPAFLIGKGPATLLTLVLPLVVLVLLRHHTVTTPVLANR